MDMISVCDNSKNTKEHLKNQQLEDIAVNDNNMIEEVFLWLSKFNFIHIYKLAIGVGNDIFVIAYSRNILSSMAAISVKSNDIINVKNHISNTLICFHLYWLDIKQDIADHSSYLNKMSVLLNVYIDMELKISTEKITFSHVKDSSKIAAKILATLYIYLDNSEEHIFRVLLRIKYAMEKYKQICDYLFMKSFTNLTTKTMFMTDITYIRYLLAFKMWKKMEEDTDKKKINKLALTLLGSRMPKLRNELLKIVPIPPAGQENETLWLLQSNLFDLKQAHRHFLLFEDKINDSANLQCIKTIHVGQCCLMSQKIQMNLCESNLNRDEANPKINEDHIDDLQNYNIKSNINGNKSVDQTYLQTKGKKNLKSLKKMRKKPGKIIVIDLTGDNEISVPYKIKRKKAKQNLEYLKIMKKRHKSQKHINTLKYSNELIVTDIQVNSNKDKSIEDKVCVEYKPISDNKVSDSTESYALINNKSSLNDAYHINFQKNEPTSITKNQMSNVCPTIMKEDEMQHNYNSHYSKIPKFFDQNIKEFKVTANMLEENKSDSHLSSHLTYATENTVNLYNNPIIQSKEVLTSQEDSAMETIPLFKMCQSNISAQHFFKESPTSTHYSTMQKTQKYCEAKPVDMHDIKHLLIKKSINDHNSQITEIIKQKVCHQVNECPNCCTKIDCKLLVFTNNDTAVKTQDNLHNMFNQNENNNVKPACETNIICMLSDRNKCVYVVNHIGECVMTTHAEKKMQCLDKSNDMCAVSSTFTGDKIVEPPLYSQHINLDNMKANDYRNATKYSEIAMKKQQRKSTCDTSISNDRIYSLESCAFHINPFKIGSNVEIERDYGSQLKNFSKAEEINEVTKSDCINDLENMNFLNNIQNDTQEDFLRQSSMMSQINYNKTIDVPIRKSFMCTDDGVTTVKTRDTLHDIFDDNRNDVKSTCDTNTIYMFSDRNKCVHIANHIGKCVINAEKRMQYLDNFNDTCTVSTTFTEDQIVESSLDGQHVNFDNARANVYENDYKYSETTLKEQGKSGCDTSMSNDRLYSSCTFDINSLEIDSKETNEMMKTEFTEDFESISFRHNIKSFEEILEDVLHQPSLMSQMNYDSSSNVLKDLEENIFSAVSDNTHTADFLSLKQSIELNSLYYNMLPDISGFENNNQEFQPPAQREEFFAKDDRKTTSPKQFEKVSWMPSTSWC